MRFRSFRKNAHSNFRFLLILGMVLRLLSAVPMGVKCYSYGMTWIGGILRMVSVAFWLFFPPVSGIKSVVGITHIARVAWLICSVSVSIRVVFQRSISGFLSGYSFPAATAAWLLILISPRCSLFLAFL